jgi:hypothetical protein
MIPKTAGIRVSRFSRIQSWLRRRVVAETLRLVLLKGDLPTQATTLSCLLNS